MDVWDESPLPSPDASETPVPDQPPTPTGHDHASGHGTVAPAPTAPSEPVEPESDSEPRDERALFQRVAGIPAWMLLVLAVVAAYAAGVRAFDASVGGTGGCPFAPNATGNVACLCSPW